MEKLEAEEIALSALAVFPPALRVAALEDKLFRDQLNVSIDAVIQLGQIGIEFRRSGLFKCIRELLGAQATDLELVDTKSKKWTISADAERKRIRISSGEKSYWLPDFYCLHPNRDARLQWLDQEIEAVGLKDDASLMKWRELLADRELDDDEVDDLLKEFRLAPSHVADGIKHHLQQRRISVGNLVPDSLTYYDRLVGAPKEDDDLRSYFDDVAIKSNRALKAGTTTLQQAFLVSSHPFGALAISTDGLAIKDVSEFFKWIVDGGDRISQVGAMEWGIRNLSLFPEIASDLEQLIRAICSDDPAEDLSRLNLLCALVMLTDGELARSGICRERPPYWRRLAAFAHASILERAIIEVNFLPDDFITWCRESRGLHFYLQTFADMRREPRWLPDLLSAKQLKYEFVGRIAGAAAPDFASSNPGSLGHFFDRDNENGIYSQVEFPFSFLPGPLEGGFSAITPMPEDISKIVSRSLEAEALTAKSFVPLVNSSLIYVLDERFAQLAAEGLRRAKHDLPQIKSTDESFNLLSGLATVAAVSRSTLLANETRVLMRLVRRKPDIKIEPENALRIGLIAASAHTDLRAWCKFVGELATELSFEEMPRNCVAALFQFLEILRQLEPALWITTARADAALRAFHPLATPPTKAIGE